MYLNLKKILYNFALMLLLCGACIILGLLSFSGMYALYPILPLAFAAFVLSVFYEGEIYIQNIKGSLNKLFKNNYLEHQLAKQYLQKHFPTNTETENCPQFFKDYQHQLILLSVYGHKRLDKASKQQKKQIEKTLKTMEHWFAQQLFTPSDKVGMHTSAYANDLQKWLAQNDQEKWQEKIKKRKTRFNWAKAFSILSGFVVGLGSTYLIVEAFSVIPFLATLSFTFWPLIIVPLAVIAGTAYGLLIYNTITDLINNKTLVTLYRQLKEDLSKGFTPGNLLRGTTAVLLIGLSIALTICTAGTWWTIAKSARPLFEWMRRIPIFIMAVIPVVIGLSASFFNMENTAETWGLLNKAGKKLGKTMDSKQGFWGSVYHEISNTIGKIVANEHWLQLLNPFRILIKLTITPLRILSFGGHVLSIGLTADRMPGLPQIVAALIAIICEGFEDAHYFIPQSLLQSQENLSFKKLLKAHLKGEGGHNHDVDFPTRILKFLASPLYVLAAAWDFIASKITAKTQNSSQPTTFKEFFDKQCGLKRKQKISLPDDAERPSSEWQVEHTISLITKHQKKNLEGACIGHEIARDKIETLNNLKECIRACDPNLSLASILQEAKNEPVYNKHRLFAQETSTSTQQFVEQLPQMVRAC